MNLKTVRYFVASAAILVTAGIAFAHHGTNASYDQSKTITLQGTVSQFLWSNPHAVLGVDIKNDKGDTEHWLGELHPPSILTRNGWNKDCLKPGDQVTVVAHPSKGGALVMEPLTVKLSTGEMFYRDGPPRPQDSSRTQQ